MQAQNGILLVPCHCICIRLPHRCDAYTCYLFKACCLIVGVPTLKHISLEHLRCKTFNLQVPLIRRHKRARELQSISWSGLTGDPQAIKNAMMHEHLAAVELHQCCCPQYSFCRRPKATECLPAQLQAHYSCTCVCAVARSTKVALLCVSIQSCESLCSRAKTLHTFLQATQAPPSPSLSGPPSTPMDTQMSGPMSETRPAGATPAADAAAQAAAFAALAGGPVRRRGANRCVSQLHPPLPT